MPDPRTPLCRGPAGAVSTALLGTLLAGVLAVPLGASGADFVRGDADGSGSADLFDVVFLTAYFYSAGATPPELDAADANDSGATEISDLVYLLRYLGGQGPPPPAPFPLPGPDPTPDVFPAPADDQVTLTLGTVVGRPGDVGLALPVFMSNTVPVEAVEAVFTFDPAVITVMGWDYSGSVLGSSAEYLVSAQLNLPPVAHAWCAAIVDFATPLDGDTIAAGDNQLLAHVLIAIDEDAEAPLMSPVVLEPASQPTKRNLAAVDGGTALSPVTVNGVIDVRVAFIRGDANRDGLVDISDTIFTLAFLFTAGTEPPCHAAADGNHDGLIDLADPVYLLNYFFGIGPAPSAPFPEPGFDPGATLGCEG